MCGGQALSSHSPERIAAADEASFVSLRGEYLITPAARRVLTFASALPALKPVSRRDLPAPHAIRNRGPPRT